MRIGSCTSYDYTIEHKRNMWFHDETENVSRETYDFKTRQKMFHVKHVDLID